MKNLVIDNKYAPALLEFINSEVINGNKEIEGVIVYDNNFLNSENIHLYDCFQALNKKFTIQEIENKLSLWFPYGILISANDFSYEVVKSYTLYLSNKYNFTDKDLFFNPLLFFQSKVNESCTADIEQFFINYKNKNDFIKNIQSQLIQQEPVKIKLDEKKFLQSKMITNVTDKNKELLEFFLEAEVFNGNSKISIGTKNICLLEYLLLRSLTSSQQLINRMMLEVNKKNLTEIKMNINLMDLSYLNNFKEQAENFRNNMRLIDKKMIYLKFEEEDKSSSGSSSKGVVKI